MIKNIALALIFVIFTNAAVIPFDNTAVQKIFQNKNPALVLFSDGNEKSKAALQALTTFDETKTEELVLTVSDKNDGHSLFQRLADYLGVQTEQMPRVLYLGSNLQKYVYDEETITAESIASFVEKVKKGEIQQSLKSAEIPEKNDGPVKIIVGKSFKELVLDSEKEILIKFYAPWCGHCKTLAPHFEEAALRLSNNPNIMIAKVDSTENEVKGIQIQGFPTLKFWGKDKSQPPIDFTGERTADGILKWLEENTKYDWVQPAAFQPSTSSESEEIKAQEEL